MSFSIIGFLGILGLIMIAIAWIPQTLQTIKQKKSNLNIFFNFLYTLGSLTLLIYSVNINDLVFIILNGSAFLLSLINLFYSKRL